MSSKCDSTVITVPTTESVKKRERQAIRDLTADFNPYTGLKGWYYQNEYTKPLNEKKNAAGVNVVTYTLEAESPYNDVSDLATAIKPFNSQQRITLNEVLAEIENACNLKFKPVEHPSQRDQADIRLFQGNMTRAGIGGLTKNCSKYRDVVIDKNLLAKPDHVEDNPLKSMLKHEILHALGLSHPGGNDLPEGKISQENGNGFNPLYSKDNSSMSYNPGKDRSAGLRKLDVAVLQYLYGEPENLVSPSPARSPVSSRRVPAFKQPASAVISK